VKYTAVMPWVVEDWKATCLDTCLFDVHTIDNSVENRGVPRSWNMGIDKMRADDSDWLILMSAAIRFGPTGGVDFLELLETHSDHRAISALHTFGWHLIAFSRETIETAGRFDENFFPAYYEDIDYAVRMYKVKPDAPWGAYAIDVSDAGMGHTIEHTGMKVDNHKLHAYFRLKWGVVPGHEWDDYCSHPFCGEETPIGFWPSVRGASWDKPAPGGWL